MNQGDKVICINDAIIDPNNLFVQKPQAGKVYTIRKVLKILSRNKNALWLNEISNPECTHPSGAGTFEPSFNINRFVPIDHERALEFVEKREAVKV